jgi:AcrR family transcriptional regulator
MNRQPTEVRREQIAEAALSIMASEGLGRFTTAAIAKQIGLAEGTLFRHFTNKNAIIDAAIAKLEGLLFRDEPVAIDEPLEELRLFLLARHSFLTTKPGYLHLLLSDELGKAAMKSARRRTVDLRARSMKKILSTLQRASEAGSIRRDVSPEFLTLIISGLLMALVFGGEHLSGLGIDTSFDRMWEDLLKLITSSSNDEL